MAAVKAYVWPANPVSRRLGRAAVLAARAVDAGGGWYPFAGRVEDVLGRIVRELRACRPTETGLGRLQAEVVCQPVLGCSPEVRAEQGCDERGVCGCGEVWSTLPESQ